VVAFVATAGKQPVGFDRWSTPKPSGQRFARWICQFEGHWSARLLLNNRSPKSHRAAQYDVADPKANQVATSQLAVDRQVEHGEVAYAMVMLKPSSNSPDMTRLQRGLGTNQASRVSVMPIFATLG
jgi:hypothetical protein